MRVIISILAAACSLAAQSVTDSRWSIGVTGGVPLGRMTSSNYWNSSEESRRYTFGPSISYSLSDKWSVDAGLLYKRIGSSSPPSSYFYDPSPESTYQFAIGTLRTRAHSLELPLMGRYHFGGAQRRWRPFVGTGFAFQTAWQTAEDESVSRDKQTGDLTFTRYKSENRRTRTDVGAIISAGISFRRGPLEFVPEIRYTRWGSFGPVRDQHQHDALLTIRWGGRK